ncbi:MAG: Do family serine endopeptidase [Phycisphaerae bacterium]|nr:Do family serine endopeptidase [Phycisphaerae bacterium]
MRSRWAWMVVLGVLLAPMPALGQRTEDITEEIQFARGLSKVFQSVARKAEPSVVHITQLNRVQQVQRDWFGFPVAVGEPRLTETGLGSGVIVSDQGYVLTNNHVVRQAEVVRVKLQDGREHEAKIVGRDPLTDVAVLKIEADGLRPATFADSDALEVGEWVVAIGSPFGFSSTVTAGIVSAKARSGLVLDGMVEGYQDFIQTDAAINPGNSGGPLLNLEGRIVGINSAIASRTGGYQGIGFAIPSNMARAVMDSLIKTGRVARGWLGVNVVDLSPREGGNGKRQGLRVEFVAPGSPAEKAGLRPGDVVTRVQGRPVEGSAKFRTSIALIPPDTDVTIDVLRNGEAATLTARVVDQLTVGLSALPIPKLGISVRTLTDEDARRRGYRGISGVIVDSVDRGSLGERAGIRQGDILRAVGDAAFASAEEFARLVDQADFREPVDLQAIRGNRRGYITVRE